jgi:hypothetical protein
VLGASRVSDALAAAPEGDEQWVDCSMEGSTCDLSAAPSRAWVKYAARASVQKKDNSFEVYQVAQGSAPCELVLWRPGVGDRQAGLVPSHSRVEPADGVGSNAGLWLGDKKDITVKASRPCIGPFDAFDSAVRHGRSEHAAQTTKVARRE